MRKMVWFALGAGVGILVYRQAVRFREQASEQGILLTATETVRSARGTVESAGRGIASVQATVRQIRDSGTD